MPELQCRVSGVSSRTADQAPGSEPENTPRPRGPNRCSATGCRSTSIKARLHPLKGPRNEKAPGQTQNRRAFASAKIRTGRDGFARGAHDVSIGAGACQRTGEQTLTRTSVAQPQCGQTGHGRTGLFTSTAGVVASGTAGAFAKRARARSTRCCLPRLANRP